MIARFKLDVRKQSLLLTLGFLLFSINSWAQLPTITTQPTNQTVCEPSTTTFNITGSNINTYHWEENDGTGWVRLTNTAPYSGVNTATLSINNTSASLNGYTYRCVIFNASAQYTNSNAASLTVNAKPAISTQPSNSRICLNDNASFSLVATGKDITYQWQEKTGSAWTNLSNTGVYSNVTTNTLNITGATAAMNNNEYRCVVAGTCSPNVISNVVILNVTLPLSLTTQPTNKVICEQDNTTFTVAGDNINTYNWEENDGSGWVRLANSAPYSGVNTATLTISNTSTGLNGKSYRCMVFNSCAQYLFSNTASLTVYAKPAISTQPSNSRICLNDNASFSLVATGKDITYQWQEKTGSAWTNLSNTGVYSNVTTNTLNITGATAAMNNNEYRCVVAGTCSPNAISNVVILNVTLPLSLTTQPTNKVICEQDNTTFTVAGDNINTYNWEENDGSGWVRLTNSAPYSGVNTATLTISSTSTGLNGNSYRCMVFNSCAQYLFSNTASLTVNAKPAISTQPSNKSICLNNNTTFSIAASGTNISYQWQVNDGSGWTDLSNSGVYTNVTTNTLNLTGVTSTMDGNEYRCIVSGTCSPNATSNDATLNVDMPPNITTQPKDQTTCENSNAKFSIVATGTGLKYQWQVDDGSGFSNISNNTTYAGATTNELKITANNTLNNYVYRCVVTGKCSPSSTSNDATLSIDLLPLVTTQPVDHSICEGTDVQFSVDATGTNTTYQWQVDNGSGYTDLSNNTIYSGAKGKQLDITAPPTSYNGYKYRCIVSGKCSPSDISNEGMLTILLTTDILTKISADTFCEGKLSTIAINANGDLINYQWQINNGTGYIDIMPSSVFSGEKSDILVIRNAPKTLHGQNIRCVATGTCKSDTTENILVNILTKPEVVTSPTNVAVIQGQNAIFSTTATGTNITYQWQGSSPGSAYSNLNDNGIYSGTKTNTLNIFSVTEAQDGFTYRCVVKGLPSCSFAEDVTLSALLNVGPPLSINNTQNSDKKVSLYPNPTSNNEITLASNISKRIDFTIVNNMGKTVYQGHVENKTTLQLNDMPSGIYTIIFKSQVNQIQPIRFTKL